MPPWGKQATARRGLGEGYIPTLATIRPSLRWGTRSSPRRGVPLQLQQPVRRQGMEALLLFGGGAARLCRGCWLEIGFRGHGNPCLVGVVAFQLSGSCLLIQVPEVNPAGGTQRRWLAEMRQCDRRPGPPSCPASSVNFTCRNFFSRNYGAAHISGANLNLPKAGTRTPGSYLPGETFTSTC